MTQKDPFGVARARLRTFRGRLGRLVIFVCPEAFAVQAAFSGVGWETPEPVRSEERFEQAR